MRRAAIALGGILAALALAIGLAALWLRTRDPLASLPRDVPSSVSAVEEWQESWEGRRLLHVALDGASTGRIRFVVSLPEAMSRRPLPLVVVLGGLRGGSDSIREISRVAVDPGPNAFVGYDWPLPRRDPGVLDVVRRLGEFRRNILSVPGQVDAILAWASRQPWADPERVSLLGFSLGGFVAPAAQRLAEARGARVRWTILAYAGAPIGAVIAGHPAAGPAFLRPVLGGAAGLLLRPVEPSLHLPYVHGRFLVLGAATDRLIEPAAAERMRELTPEPRTVIRIRGDHMGVGPNRLRLLREVVETSRSWLVAQGAIDLPAASPAATTREGDPADPVRSAPAGASPVQDAWRATPRP